MQENILMILSLDEIKKITEGLRVALNYMDGDEGGVNENQRDNIEDILIKLLNAQYECWKN